MADYQRDRSKVDAAMRASGIVVVMNRSHIQTPQHMVTTMKAVYEAGYVAECLNLAVVTQQLGLARLAWRSRR